MQYDPDEKITAAEHEKRRALADIEATPVPPEGSQAAVVREQRRKAALFQLGRKD